jgi:hypothetical protein
MKNPQYDVAISFLSQDEAIAAAIWEKLSEGLQVFFFPRRQEELSGTDGLESMRKPFFDNSRVMVVLYRERWGKTPWTRIEETAIKEACLEHGWQRLFFVVLDPGSALPLWLPQNHIRFNYGEYGPEQAVGAIKARVQENGGQPQPLTAIRRAEIFNAEESFRQDKSRMNSQEGIAAVIRNVAELFQQIDKKCGEINANGSLQIKCGADPAQGSAKTCVITDGSVSLSVVWRQQYSNSLQDSGLIIREYNGGLRLPGETGQFMYMDQPRQLCESKYSPDLSRAREYGWTKSNADEFLSSVALAEQSVIRFVDLVSRFTRGEIRN